MSLPLTLNLGKMINPVVDIWEAEVNLDLTKCTYEILKILVFLKLLAFPKFGYILVFG